MAGGMSNQAVANSSSMASSSPSSSIPRGNNSDSAATGQGSDISYNSVTGFLENFELRSSSGRHGGTGTNNEGQEDETPKIHSS